MLHPAKPCLNYALMHCDREHYIKFGGWSLGDVCCTGVLYSALYYHHLCLFIISLGWRNIGGKGASDRAKDGFIPLLLIKDSENILNLQR